VYNSASCLAAACGAMWFSAERKPKPKLGATGGNAGKFHSTAGVLPGFSPADLRAACAPQSGSMLRCLQRITRAADELTSQVAVVMEGDSSHKGLEHLPQCTSDPWSWSFERQEDILKWLLVITRAANQLTLTLSRGGPSSPPERQKAADEDSCDDEELDTQLPESYSIPLENFSPTAGGAPLAKSVEPFVLNFERDEELDPVVGEEGVPSQYSEADLRSRLGNEYPSLTSRAPSPCLGTFPGSRENGVDDGSCPGGDSAAGPGLSFTPDETILIFDWDDTLFPSTWVHDEGWLMMRCGATGAVPAAAQAQLARVAEKGIESLRVAKELGTVLVVTNAEKGWIELSCQKLMPELSASLRDVKCLSARSSFTPSQKGGDSSPLLWKVTAFERELRRLYNLDDDVSDAGDSRRKNVISIGDSMVEREAVMHVASSLQNCRWKSLKFVERPSIDQMCTEHAVLVSCMARVARHNGDLDLCVR